MSKKMLIDASHAEETRVVVLDGNRLEDYDVETVSRKQIKGNIYLAKVIRVEPSLQAAFVDYGGNRHGFLAFGEIHPDYYQIPVADRQKLLALQAEAEAEASRAEEDMAAALDSGAIGSGAESAADTQGDVPAETETAIAPEAEDSARPSNLEAQALGIRPIPIYAAPPPDAAEEERAEAVELASPDLVSHSLSEPETSEPETQEPESDAPERQAPQDQVEPANPDEAVEIGRVESFEATPEPEQLGGDGDDAAEARERRLRQRFLRNYKIQDVIHRRQIMLVQVVKEERGNKGAALTTYLSLAGRFSVLMPNSPTGGGVSRKITSQTDRRRLKETMAELDIPQGMGMIVRTAGANRPKPEIKRDCEYLLRLWDDIRDKTLESTAPALIYEEANLIKRAIRDVYTRDVESIMVEGEEGYKAAQDFMRMLMPANARKVQLWREGQPLFSKHQVETQLDAMLNPVVQLRSGGYIVINQTEALVAIDVNSGRSTKERNVEDTALRTNLEAVEEVAKQLRMRDLAGLIVVDFIDMESRKNNLAVERKMKDALRHDRARIQVGAISHFGLMEMSRQRLRPSLTEASLIACPHCNGMGHIRSPESAALHILRAIEDEGAKFKAAEIGVSLPPEIALYLFNHKRERLSQIEARYAMRVVFNVDPTLAGGHFRLERLKAQTAHPPAATPIRAERALEAIPPAEVEAEDAAMPESGNERPDRKRRRRRRGRRDQNAAERQEPRPESSVPVVETDYDSAHELDLALEAALGGLAQDDNAAEPSLVTPLQQEDATPTDTKPPRGGRKRKPAGKASAAKTPDDTHPISAEPEAANPERAETETSGRKRGPRKRRPTSVPETADAATGIEVASDAVSETVIETPVTPQAEAPVETPTETLAEPLVKPILVGGAEIPAAKKTGWWRR